MKKDNAMVKEIKEYMGKEIKEIKGYINASTQRLRSEIGEVKRHAGVLVEGLRSEVKIIAEQHGSTMRKLEEHDRRFDEIDIRFDRVDLEFKGMKTALFDNSHRLNDHEGRIRKLEMRD